MFSENIAPCGMNCHLCYAFIRPKNRCLGCNAPDEYKPKSCSNCKIVICEQRTQNRWRTCAECDTSCRRLKDLDKRYCAKYHMSMIENLSTIRLYGMGVFLELQDKRYRCPACHEMVCVHKDECPSCKRAVWKTSKLPEYSARNTSEYYVALAEEGTRQSIDKIMLDLNENMTVVESRFIDWALSLVNSDEGLKVMEYYLLNGTTIHSNYCALYFARRGEHQLVTEAYEKGKIDRTQYKAMGCYG